MHILSTLLIKQFSDCFLTDCAVNVYIAHIYTTIRNEKSDAESVKRRQVGLDQGCINLLDCTKDCTVVCRYLVIL